MFNLKKIKKITNFFGLDVSFFPNNTLKSRLKFMDYGKFDIVLDVGANVGQFGKEIRKLGYKNKIISFEPLSSAFEVLKKVSVNDLNWDVFNFALGNNNESSEINISRHNASSSILNFEKNYIAKNSLLEIVNSEKIEIKKLDSIFTDIVKNPYNSVLLKIDTQGFEKKVLDGAHESLKNILAIQIETSMIEIYKGETTFIEILSELRNYGFEIFTLEPYYFEEKTSRLLQTEVYLLKKDFIKSLSL